MSGIADHRRLVGLRGELLGLGLQPVEVERPGRPEIDLAGPGGGPHQAAIEQGGECADARGEQRLSAIELHGTPEEAISCRDKPKPQASHRLCPFELWRARYSCAAPVRQGAPGAGERWSREIGRRLDRSPRPGPRGSLSAIRAGCVITIQPSRRGLTGPPMVAPRLVPAGSVRHAVASDQPSAARLRGLRGRRPSSGNAA